MIPDTRPDRSRVMFHDAHDPKKPNDIYVHVFPDHPTAWRAPPILDHINMMRSRGVTVHVLIGDRSVILFPDGTERHLAEGPADRTALRELVG